MADIDPCDIPHKKDPVCGTCHTHQIVDAIELADLCLGRGLEVSVNYMAAT